MFSTTENLLPSPKLTAFLSVFHSYLQTFARSVRKRLSYVKSLFYFATHYAIHLSAFMPTSGIRGLVRMRGFIFKKRSGAAEEYAIDLIIVFILAAVLFPIAQNLLVSATTTNWNSAVVVMFEVLLPILIVVALVRHFT